MFVYSIFDGNVIFLDDVMSAEIQYVCVYERLQEKKKGRRGGGGKNIVHLLLLLLLLLNITKVEKNQQYPAKLL